MNYEKLTELVEEILNRNGLIFQLDYVINLEEFNLKNLVYDDQVHGVMNLVSRTPNTIQLIDNSLENGITANGTEIYQIQLFAPLKFEKELEMQAQINNFITIWNNQAIELEDTTFFTSNTSIVSWAKYPTSINGDDYQLIIIQFNAITYTNFLFGNSRELKINDVGLDCVVDVNFATQKMFNSLVFQDGIAKNQDNGLQWSLIVDVIYNKESQIHQSLIADWELSKSYSINYKIGALTFNKDNAKLQSYLIQDITGDVIKLRFTFVEGGA